ncbi:MAG: hydroxysqualene dehydroxylase HpnE [Pseudomonadota bacterium]
MAARVAIIGAGYAGLACAVELADAGFAVDVIEASRTLGGRARAVELDGLTVDNGAHILVGAYRETLRLIKKVSPGGTAALRRHRLHLEYPGRVRIAAPALPAPLHLAWALLAARGLNPGEKIAAIRFMRALQARRFRLPQDTTAAELFAGQPPRLRRFLWEPLCLAALNTPVAMASAQVFLNVLRDSLAADRAASDLLLPATDFSSLFPEPAAGFIEARGGRLVRAQRVTAIEKNGGGWTVNGSGPYPHLVLAVAPQHLSGLLGPHPECAPIVRRIEGFAWQPIATCYLRYPAGTRLPFPMTGMNGGHAQWLFDRGTLCGQDGLLAAVISGDGPWQSLGHAALAAAIHQEVSALLPGLPQPLASRVIEEKRATFCCTPDLERPGTATACPGLWLAGDYVAGDYPATLEGAVRSGIAAARAVRDAFSGT